jgi:hypothetical protein
VASVQPAEDVGFNQRLELQGIAFRVSSSNAATGNSVTVTTTGLEIDNSPWESSADGDVVGAEVGDLDANGSPEIYVYVTSRDPGARGSVVGYAANNRKSLSAINLPPLSDNPAAAAGYRGHDEFAIVEQSLALPALLGRWRCRQSDRQDAPAAVQAERRRGGLAARTRQLDRVLTTSPPIEPYPLERTHRNRPSSHLTVLCLGAAQCGLPSRL